MQCLQSHIKITAFNCERCSSHDYVIKWKYFPRYWPFVRGIHWSPVNSPHKGQWRGALMFSLICARINGWVNNGEAGDLRRHRAHYDVIVMSNVGPIIISADFKLHSCWEYCQGNQLILSETKNATTKFWTIYSPHNFILLITKMKK